MKKLTTLALAGAMAVSSFATASATRWTGFGVASLFIADVQDTFTLPQTVASNADAMYLEFGPQYHYDAYNNQTEDFTPGTQADASVDGSAWGGSHMKIGPGVLGIWGNRPYNGASNLWFASQFWGYGTPNDVPSGLNANTNYLMPTNTIDLFYAWDMGDKVTLGVGVNHSGEFQHYDEKLWWGGKDIYNQSAADWGLSLGVDIKDLGPIATLQIGVQYNNGSSTNSADNYTIVNSNSLTYNVANIRIGADIAGSKGKFQRIELGANSQAGAYASTPGAGAGTNDYTSESATAMTYDLGWAMGMSSAKGMGLSGLILTGGWGDSTAPHYVYNTGGDHFEWNWTNLTFASAGEGKINSWLTGRAGFSTTIYATDSQYRRNQYTIGGNGSTRNWSESDYSTVITLGLGINVGDITIDGALNQDLLYNGPYFTNGIQTPLFSQVSATWAWGATKE